MKIVVKYITVLREITQKQKETIELRQPSTVSGVLEVLLKRYGDRFRQYLFENGRIRADLHILINSKPLHQLENVATKLEDGDEIAIIPTFFPVSGG